MTLAVDHTRQRPKGYTQVVAGVAPTLRPANRQYPQIAADLGYTPPSFNAFDRLTDVDTPLRSYQELGGTSLNVDWKLGTGRLTSTTAWRYWDWKPSNDRDFIGLPITSISAAPSYQTQWTQEVRYAGDLAPHLNFVAGVLLLPAGARFRSVVQAGAGLGGRALPAGADAGRRDAGPARRLRLQPVPEVPQHQRRGLRSARMVGHRSPAPAAGPPVQLRPEGRGLRSAGLRRPADDRSRRSSRCSGRCSRRRPTSADVDDTNLSGQMTVAYQVATQRQHLRDLRDQLQVGRPQPERRADRRARSPGALGGDGEARGRAATSRSASRPSRSAASPPTSPSSTPTSRTSRRRS